VLQDLQQFSQRNAIRLPQARPRGAVKMRIFVSIVAKAETLEGRSKSAA
jgi:hypothetical protein